MNSSNSHSCGGSRRDGLSLFSAGLNPRKIELIDRHGTGESLLDIGCGNGLYPLATARSFVRVLQIDLVDRRSSEARDIPFEQMDAADVGSVGQRFDTVLCFDIIEHLDDDESFVRAVRGICDGCLIGSVPADEDTILRAVGLTHVHHVDKTHRREYSRETLAALLSRAGFTKVTVIPQRGEGLVYAPHALASGSLVSKVIARMLIALNLLLCRLGVFRNAVVADWLFVAR
jgi:SAM-dependent methyltransferase